MKTVLITFVEDKFVEWKEVKEVAYQDVGIGLTFEDHETIVPYTNMLYVEIYG